MARHRVPGGGGLRASTRHLTHKFPGEHYLAVRPIRDDLRRSVAEVPRRAVKQHSKSRRQDSRKVSQLTKETHKGKTAKTQQNSSTGRQMPTTAKARPMGDNRPVRVGSAMHGSKGGALKQTGVKVHKPRLLSPHPPRAYHLFPVKRISEHIFH
jgi:hypothetical protein